MKIAGYILAGGDNRRMEGKKKLYLEREGRPFGQWICEAFSGLSGIYISAADVPPVNLESEAADPASGNLEPKAADAPEENRRPGEKAESQPSQLPSILEICGQRLPVIYDRYGHIGPIGGIASGLGQCQADALFVAACDMPFVSQETVRLMVETFERKPVLTIARSGEWIHPLFAIYPRELLPLLEEQIRNQDYRMMQILEKVEYEIVDFGDDSRELRNINTREQYEQMGDPGQSEHPGKAGYSSRSETFGRGDHFGQPGDPGRAGHSGQLEPSGSIGSPSQRRPGHNPFIFAISGYKNSGKTTLITRLIPILVSRGYRVAVIKHDGHDFESDVPGTDSYRHQQAGAYGTAVFSSKRLMVTKEIQGVDEARLFAAFPEADIILIEGLKDSPYPKYFCNYPKEEPVSPEELADRIEKAMQET